MNNFHITNVLFKTDKILRQFMVKSWTHKISIKDAGIICVLWPQSNNIRPGALRGSILTIGSVKPPALNGHRQFLLTQPMVEPGCIAVITGRGRLSPRYWQPSTAPQSNWLLPATGKIWPQTYDRVSIACNIERELGRWACRRPTHIRTARHRYIYTLARPAHVELQFIH